jgi:hypothetical protein
MSQEIKDTYFLSGEEAFKVASLQNKSKDGYTLQVCYYDGEKIETDLVNLIHLPIENLIEGLATSHLRIPKYFNMDGFDFSQDTTQSIIQNFTISVEQAFYLRNELNKIYLESISCSKPNFEESLRFYIPANNNTRVMQHMSRNIADALISMGYDVFLDIHYGCEDNNCLKNIAEYNPHVTININHLSNMYLSDDIFNFVWVQDIFGVEGIRNSKHFRKRDYIYHLVDAYGLEIKKLHLESVYQPFCINGSIYKKRDDIKKEKKIVFIGSSYNNRITDIKKDMDFPKIYEEMISIFEKKGYLRDTKYENSEIKYLMDKYNKVESYIGLIYGYILRDYCVEKLCSLDTDYQIEVYGDYWEENEIVKPFLIGFLDYGEEISKVYNSATYGYCVGGYVLMQRTLECALSETIPLVLDVREDSQDNYDSRIEESFEFFKISELEKVLTQQVREKKFHFIKKFYSYESFVNKMLDEIDKNE